MKIVKGDLIKLAEAGQFDVIVHGCNCFNTMGSGIAASLRRRYPQVYEEDLKTTFGDINKLGTFTTAQAGNFTIVNAYTQYDFNRHGSRADVFEYTAFKLILEKLARSFPEGTRFGFPMIGTGLAAGNVERILTMLDSFAQLVEPTGSVTVVEYEAGK